MKKTIKDKVCAWRECENVFKPYRFNQKHCSKKCFYNDERAKPKKEKKVYKIPLKSEKRKKEDKVYLAKRIVFLKENQFCAVYPNKKATEVHHMRGRVGSLYLDERYWLAVSREGHKFIEENPIEAKKNGWSLSRLSK